MTETGALHERELHEREWGTMRGRGELHEREVEAP